MTNTVFRRAAIPAALALSLGLAACGAANETTPSGGGSSSASALSGDLAGAGASSQQAAQTAWAAGFNAANPDVTLSYDAVGSGGGRKQFLAGAVPFAGSDAYLKDDELTQAQTTCAGGNAMDLPVYVSPIAIAYNLPSVSDLQLSAATLAGIFAGTITTWNDPAIAADNPSATLPSTKITPVHRSDDSGTTENFTDYLHATAPDAWASEADGTWPLPGGEAAKGTSGVVQAVQGTEGGIGYADESQVAATELGSAKIKVGEEYVGPTAEAAAKTVDASTEVEGRPEGDIAIQVDRTTTESGAYPIILVSYLVVCSSYEDAEQGKLVKAFAEYVSSSEGQEQAAKTAGNAPISDTLRSQITESLDKIGA